VATLDEWTSTVCEALDIPADLLATRLVLDVARDVAHGVARPAAPLTAYLAGVAVGRGVPADQVQATINELLAQWPAPAE
jgi:hypothetical protein